MRTASGASRDGQDLSPALRALEAPQPKRLITTKDLCRFLGVSVRWVHERTRLGEIPCYRFGKTLRFDPEEIRQWITQYHHRETEGVERGRP